MLNVFWELKPSYTALPYLVHLCGHFSTFPKEILLNNSFQSRRMFYLLTHSRQHLLYNCPYNITVKDLDKAVSLCDRFIAEAEKATEQQLRLLKVKSFQKNNPLHYKTI